MAESFNPRSCTRSDVYDFHVWPSGSVSIHAPVQGATVQRVEPIDWPEFQSTLLYKERLIDKKMTKSELRVSIHAPVQGATYHHWSMVTAGWFQSTLLYKERLLAAIPSPIPDSFNPRSCTRSDAVMNHKINNLQVSIHAPVQGATYDDIAIRLDSLFQSTLLYKERQPL